ncbi:hypothetical protein ZIOFF_046008 [Zingiber officinale]|uniref:Glutamate decarboxylase n=1 Tax=Zingiber officinale TaxID=94328 RepID=A0A8J5KVS8_ZINOF|nr:hypothetical protein ZIOFF_046008 [Zingiber officinale]
MENCTENMKVLKAGIEATERFEIVSKAVGVPLVAFSLRDTSKYTVCDISESLRRFGWIVPACTMPADAEHVAVLRVVIREDFSRSLADRLVTDIGKVSMDLDHRWTRTSVIAHVQAEEHPERPDFSKSIREITSRRKALVRRNRKTSGVC